jgi:hypothetical protein
MVSMFMIEEYYKQVTSKVDLVFLLLFADYLIGLLFSPEDGNSIFFRNVIASQNVLLFMVVRDLGLNFEDEIIATILQEQTEHE